MAQGKTIDRITERFVGGEPGNFRRLFELHASGEKSDRALMAEILSYAICCLNDSFCESPHAELTAVVLKKRRGLPPLWFSMIRYTQNMKFKKYLDIEFPGLFSSLYGTWKSLFGRRPGRKLKKKQFLDKVYRLGQEAIVDTNAMGVNEHQKSFGATYLPSALKAQALNNRDKIRKDYLVAILQNDTVYSFPRENSSQPCIVDAQHSDSSIVAQPLVNAGLAGIESAIADDSPYFFMVVSAADGRKELVEPASCHWKSMNLPISIIELSIHKSTVGEPLQHFAFSAGRPIWVDALGMMTWTTVKTALQQWKCDQVCSELAGCMRIHSPSMCNSIQWFQGHLLKVLLDDGVSAHHSCLWLFIKRCAVVIKLSLCGNTAVMAIV